MKLEDVKRIAFPHTSIEDWLEAAESSMKGKNVKTLTTDTYEGLNLEPIYTEEGMQNAEVEQELPGEFPYTRGIYPTGFLETPWRVCQPVSGKNAEEANQNMRSALDRGQDVITFSKESLTYSVDELFNSLPVGTIPIYIDIDGKKDTFFDDFCKYCEVANIEPNKISGVLADDPIVRWAELGNMPIDSNLFFHQWFKNIEKQRTIFPMLKSILIKASVYHNAGANAVQELAYSIAQAVTYISEGQKRGMKPEEVAEQMIFSYAVDSNYFMSIAKIRAARRLLSLLSTAYEADPQSFKMQIHAVSSGLSQTLFDKHVNILRSANSAFAAAIGGVQYLQVLPFDVQFGVTSSLSERLARNTQLILKEETHVTRVSDPSGGSWYIEQLTEDLVEESWGLFVQIEEKGGILQLLNEGSIQKDIEDMFNKRLKNAAERKERIIGTNVYPNPAEKVEQPVAQSYAALTKEQDSLSIAPITSKRVAQEFESIRLRSLSFKQKAGNVPMIGLINLGDLKSSKPRADFIKGVTASGGIETVESTGCHNESQVSAFIKETDLPVYCICGSDADYEEIAVSLIASIKQHPKAVFYLAGRQTEGLREELLATGVKDFISVKTNGVLWIKQLLQELGVN
jgi:methylmalonyl-CoA mutase